jgi:hypothetical protein
MLKSIGVKKSATPHKNLVEYLCLHKKVPDNLLVDKIRKAIKESDKLKKQKSLGFKVNNNYSLKIIF